jgi:hypothetical protein
MDQIAKGNGFFALLLAFLNPIEQENRLVFVKLYSVVENKIRLALTPIDHEKEHNAGR